MLYKADYLPAVAPLRVMYRFYILAHKYLRKTKISSIIKPFKNRPFGRLYVLYLLPLVAWINAACSSLQSQQAQ